MWYCLRKQTDNLQKNLFTLQIWLTFMGDCSIHKQMQMHIHKRTHSRPGYKSTSRHRDCRREKNNPNSVPTSPPGSLLFLTTFFYDSIKFMDALPLPLPPHIHFISLPPHTPLLPCPVPGITTMKILFWGILHRLGLMSNG